MTRRTFLRVANAVALAAHVLIGLPFFLLVHVVTGDPFCLFMAGWSVFFAAYSSAYLFRAKVAKGARR